MDETSAPKIFDQKNVIPDEIRLKLTNHVNENWDKIITALTDLAVGIWYEHMQVDKNGDPVRVRVYQQKPDTTTAQWLANQVIGKPKEAMNIEGKVTLILDA